MARSLVDIIMASYEAQIESVKGRELQKDMTFVQVGQLERLMKQIAANAVQAYALEQDNDLDADGAADKAIMGAMVTRVLEGKG